MNIESKKTILNKPAKEVFDFLIDVKNFEKLMPENTSKFEILDSDRFVFALKGMPEIVLKLKEQYPHNKVVLGAASDKLPFTLTAHINEIEDNKCETNLVFEGDFNPMMGMMIKGPITNFIGTLTDNMSKI
ncbi:SRPBCC family protein [Abyssalbus ytuae]|uniref:SRPBCC family protein n=1 Tax=Abyssalbus ytuae TaxID=2926907 RepID=A0A9E7D1E5_9FLAO|nr:SRPBCC family protein [Abyssalbus ytuae]UOB17003.1 SRPBCC family protein [Abyssalbus ytuae]